MPPPAEGFATRFVLGPALRTQPDRRLVALVREGYETAFEEIVRRYGKALTRYAAAIVGSRGEDVTQDAFSKALLALRRSDAEIELRPWLFRIVRNTALNDLRDRPPTPEALAETVAGGSSPAETLERREELADLMRRLRSLPEPQRAAIVMRELEGLSHEEIAAALGLSGGAARQTIHRARRALRSGLGMLLPLPLLKALLAGGAIDGAEMASAGVAGAGGAGAGVALKAATATVLVAGAVGTGMVVEEARKGGDQTRAQPQRVATGSPPASQSAAPSTGSNRSSEGSDDRGRDSGEREPGGDREGSGGGDSSGPGPGDDRERDDDRGRDEEVDDDHSGRGRGGDNDRQDGRDSGGHSGPSHEDEVEDDAGHRSGSSQQLSSSGPGSGSGESDELEDHSGPGSGSSLSGGEGPDTDDDTSSSGPGSGDEELEG